MYMLLVQELFHFSHGFLTVAKILLDRSGTCYKQSLSRTERDQRERRDYSGGMKKRGRLGSGCVMNVTRPKSRSFFFLSLLIH